MIDQVLTVMFSAISLAQTGQAAITTNELAPPPGMSTNGAPAVPQKTGTPSKVKQASPSEKPAPSPETRSQAPAGDAKDVVVENAAPVPAPSGTEMAQPTSEERQAPTPKQANGAESPGRVAAFWFILPNRPSANK